NSILNLPDSELNVSNACTQLTQISQQRYALRNTVCTLNNDNIYVKENISGSLNKDDNADDDNNTSDGSFTNESNVKRKYACKGCGGYGHNIRKCKYNDK
ncbi:2737_t:CDS:1, partial [Dentiscutata erythropus]